MKKRLFILFVFALGLSFGCSKNNEQPVDPPEAEVTLFDRYAKPIAYINYADKDSTFYMWKGTPVAYFAGEKEVYRFNGQFLGWYVRGVLYDREGYAVAAMKGVKRGQIDINETFAEPLKSLRQLKPVPHVRSLAPVSPVFKDEWSAVDLSDFLLTR